MINPTTPIRVVAVDDDSDILTWVEATLQGHPRIELVGTGKNGREALQLANRLRPDVIVLDVNMPVLNGLEAAARISSAFPSIGILMLTSETAIDVVKEALRSGVREYLSKTTDMDRIVDAIVETESKRDRNAPTKGMASVWTFYGPKSTCGTSTVALNTAFELASLDYQVLLVDLDPLHGDCGFYLDLQPRPRKMSLLCQLEELTEIDARTMKQFIRRHSLRDGQGPAIDLIDSPCTFVNLDQKCEENLGLVMDYLLMTYDYIVADLPPGKIFDRSIILMLDYAEQIFVSSTRDMSGMKGLVVFTKILGQTAFSLNKLMVLFNGMLDEPGFDHEGYSKKLKEQVRDVLTVPVDREACARALRRGVPVTVDSPGSPLSQFIRGLVESSLNLPPRQSGKPSLWASFKQLLGAMSSRS